MKKHELLKHAYDNYPKGTKFNNLGTTKPVITISSGVFHLDEYGVRDSDTFAYIFGSENKWADIITQEKPKSVLDGKVAIQVNNEREFNLLMKHYESKGWKSEYIEISAYPYYIDYKNKFDSSENTSAFTSRGEKIISFQDFAKEVGIEVPKFIMKSEDGVDLYEGDDLHYTSYENGKFILRFCKLRDNYKPTCYKLFSTKQAAFKWIEEQNKPKEIKVKLDGATKLALIRNDKIITTKSNSVMDEFTHSDIEAIYNAIKSLK